MSNLLPRVQLNTPTYIRDELGTPPPVFTKGTLIYFGNAVHDRNPSLSAVIGTVMAGISVGFADEDIEHDNGKVKKMVKIRPIIESYPDGFKLPNHTYHPPGQGKFIYIQPVKPSHIDYDVNDMVGPEGDEKKPTVHNFAVVIDKKVVLSIDRYYYLFPLLPKHTNEMIQLNFISFLNKLKFIT